MRTRGFDKLWRWQVTDELDMPDGKKVTVTARRLTRALKRDRDDYAFNRARAMNRALGDEDSEEYRRRLLPITKWSTEELLRILETNERVLLTAKAQREFLSPSPSDREDDFQTLKDRLDAAELEDEAIDQLDEERLSWVEANLSANMEALKEMSHDELLNATMRTATDGAANEEWYAGYVDASLRLGVFMGDKPFFDDWPTEADDDLKAKLLQLYMDADAASFDFSF